MRNLVLLLLLIAIAVCVGCSSDKRENVAVDEPEVIATPESSPEPSPEPTPEPTPMPVMFTITFDPTGGAWVDDDINPLEVEIEEESYISGYMPGEPVKDGYTFYGWVYSSLDFFDESAVADGDIALYAAWMQTQHSYALNKIELDFKTFFLSDDTGEINIETLIDTESYIVNEIIINICHIGAEDDITYVIWDGVEVISGMKLIFHEGVNIEHTGTLMATGGGVIVNYGDIASTGRIIARGDGSKIINEGTISMGYVDMGSWPDSGQIWAIYDGVLINNGYIELDASVILVGQQSAESVYDGTFINNGEVYLIRNPKRGYNAIIYVDRGYFKNAGIITLNGYTMDILSDVEFINEGRINR